MKAIIDTGEVDVARIINDLASCVPRDGAFHTFTVNVVVRNQGRYADSGGVTIERDGELVFMAVPE